MQAPAAAPEYLPVGHHVHFWHASFALDKYSPARHVLPHAALPVSDVYVPSAQAMHDVCATESWYVPAAHGVHACATLAALVKYLPAAQLLAVHVADVCSRRLYVPAEQAWQPAALIYHPEAVNTHAFSAPVTAGAPAVLAVAQATADADAAAQLALVPPAVTAQVPSVRVVPFA